MRNLTLVAVIITAMTFVSCQKELPRPGDLPLIVTPPPGTPSSLTLNKIQHKWNFVSLMLFPTADLTGPGLPVATGNGSEYFDFRTDMKMYTYLQNSFDTSNYVMLTDSVFKVNQYYGGVLSAHTDTVTIKVLSNNSFVFSFRNVTNDYGRFILSR